MRRFLVMLLLFIASPAAAGTASVLEAFIDRPDTAFHWKKGSTWQDGDVEFTEVALASQSFQGTVWKHVLALARPKNILAPGHALLIVGGGNYGEPPAKTPAGDQARMKDLALKSGLPVAMIQQVPFQPIFYGRIEDDAIAYSLMRFFKAGDVGWPLLQPMVKTVVRAMDTVQELARQEWHAEITGFTVTGESKRGWTTYLTAAVDRRVKAFIPMVFDMLNMRPQLAHQLASWGTYSEQIGDYAEHGLPKMLETPRGADLLAIIDPYSYRARLAQPKIVVLGTNDRYWPADSASIYFDDLPGEKYLLYLPNAGHDLPDRRLIEEDRVALALAAAGSLTLPRFTGNFSAKPAVTIGLTSDTVPQHVRVWRATSATHDFRQAKWEVTGEPQPARIMNVVLPAAPQGFAAVFLEATYDVSGHPFTATSALSIYGGGG